MYTFLFPIQPKLISAAYVLKDSFFWDLRKADICIYIYYLLIISGKHQLLANIQHMSMEVPF